MMAGTRRYANNEYREQTADFVEQLYLAGRLSDALHEMKAFRCDLMDAVHQCHRRVDCLDYLIRQTEKEIKKGNLKS